jgi:hypothetical protein
MTGRYRKPAAAPNASEVADLAEFDRLTQDSLKTVQTSAETWRTGLAALVTLVTTGFFLKGPDTAGDLPSPMRWIVVLLASVGLVLVVAGLHYALRAVAGSPATVDYATIRATYGSVRAYQVALARQAADDLRMARQLVMTYALPILGITALLWVVATKPADKAVVEVTANGARTCGALLSADAQNLRIKVSGDDDTRVIPIATVTDMRVALSCG